MSKKAYLLLFDTNDKSIILAVKSDTSAYVPGGPALFGGTRDYDVSKKESTTETIVRELKEESSERIRLKKVAKVSPFYSAEGGKSNFYWTSDFTANLNNFPGNSEIKDVIGIDALHLLNNAPTRSELGRHLLFLVGSTLPGTSVQFLQSYTLRAIYHWITAIFGQSKDLQPVTPENFDWLSHV
jgi:hypothetical protein